MEAQRGPLISVIVPVYNAAPFLARTVESVCAQTYRPLEILLVDDGSQDDSLALCRKLAAGDSRIRVLRKENGGASSARNLGVREARGEYVGFVDSDDLITPDMYERLAQALAEWKRDGAPFLLQIGRDEQDEQGKPLPPAVRPPERATFISSERFIESLLLYTGDSSFCTKLSPRALLLENPFPEGVLGEDFLLHMKLLPQIAGVLAIPGVGYHVVHRAGSVTRRLNASHFSRAYIDIVRHADYVERELCPRYPALADEARRYGLYQRLDYLLHVPIEDMNGGNAFYCEVMAYLRRHFGDTVRSRYLTVKNKVYLTLLTIAPRAARRAHRRIRGM